MKRVKKEMRLVEWVSTCVEGNKTKLGGWTHKLQIQLPAVAMAMHRARYCEGKSSATAAHERGPQVVAKAAMARHEKAIRTPPASGVDSGSSRLSEK